MKMKSNDNFKTKRSSNYKRPKAKPCKCQYEGCGKIISSISNLSRHHLVHAGIKPYQCEICNKKFTQRVNLVKHRKVHEMSCDSFSCGESDFEENGYSSHLLIRSSSDSESQKTFTSIPSSEVVFGEDSFIDSDQSLYIQDDRMVIVEQFADSSNLRSMIRHPNPTQSEGNTFPSFDVIFEYEYEIFVMLKSFGMTPYSFEGNSELNNSTNCS